MIARVFLLLASAVAMAGCVSSRKISSSTTARISRDARIAIRVPADGSYAGEPYPGSGRAVAAGLKSALIRFYPRVEIAERGDSDFTIKPEILHWEDRATEWSGRPDRVSISLQTYDRSGRTVDATVIDAKSSWWTFGGDKPEGQLTRAFADYAGRLSQ